MPQNFFRGLLGWDDVNAAGGQAQAAQNQAIAGQGLLQYQAVIRNDNGMVWYDRPIQNVPPRRQLPEDGQEALLDFSDTWARLGLELNELIVSKETFMKLYQRMPVLARYVQRNELPRHELPEELNIYTATGCVTIRYEAKSKFDLQKYMETVDNGI